jgi:oxygen-independent coproporphyrinogen-3 oxidase
MTEFLYIHIPFCIKKCLYCDFLSVTYNELLAKAYTDALCKELVLKKDFAGELKTIYIGGGTPTILPDECFRQLFTCLQNNYSLSPSPEITVEANPGTIDESKIKTLLSLGVNRISIGVQSFNDDELKTLGRIHTSDEALKAIEAIKDSGIKNFSIDLIYGIQGQTMESWKHTLSKAAAFTLSPTHISSYELTPEKNTPLYGLIEKDKIKMPDEGLILEMYNYAIDYLASKDYEHYEISNFALPRFRCLHNLNYWDRGEYLSAGAGAHSFVRGFRSKNTDDIRRYIKDLNKGIIPEAELTEIKRDDAIKEFIFLGLRKTEGISLAMAKELGLDMPVVCKELIEDGHLEMEGDYLRLTRKGLVISNAIIVKLFEGFGLD